MGKAMRGIAEPLFLWYDQPRTQGKTLDCLFNVPATMCFRVAFNVSLPSVQQDCGGSGGHGSAPGGALTPPR